MGIRFFKVWKRRFLFLVGTSLTFLLFQNMTPYEEMEDARGFFQQKPEGYSETSYLPMEVHSGTVNGVANEILDYNFSGPLKMLEGHATKYFSWGGEEEPLYDDVGSASGARGPASVSMVSRRPRIGYLGGDRLGLSYESGLKFNCNYSMRSQSLQMSVEKALGVSTNLSLKHNTEQQLSSVSFSYQW